MKRSSFFLGWLVFALAALCLPARLMATASNVYHEQTSNDPTAGGSGSTCPSGTRYVDVLSPLPTQSYTLHFQVALSGSTDHARVYYTTNGSAPVGSYGVPGANTFVAVANYQCSFRTPAGAPVDICSAAIPPLPGGTVVNYIISAWQAVTPPSPEIFANGGQCGGSTCATIFTYRVIPTTPINLTCSPNLTVTATSPNGAVVNYNSSATGGCSQPVVTCTPRSGSTFPIGQSTVSCTATDTCGTVATCGFIVTVAPPIQVSCSPNVTVPATGPGGAVVNYGSATATGGCSPPVVHCNPPSGSTFPIGTTPVSCTATDSCGGSTICTFSVTVNPPPPILLTCSSNITVTASGPGGVVVFYSSSASGGCSPPPSLTCTPPSGSTFPIGTTTVSCTATDTCGTVTSCSFTVKVNPPPPILLNCSTNITVSTTAPDGAIVTYSTASASGGCGGLNVSCFPPSGSKFPIGTNTVTCTASDQCGTRTNCSFLVIVKSLNIEIDTFPNTVADLTLLLPNGGTETVTLSGPTTVRVAIGPNGQAGDSNNDGLDDVPTEMVQLDLTGNSSLGPVMVHLDPTQPSTGMIEETVNNHPGILDIPPFEPTGTANSFFDIFAEVEVSGQTLRPATSLHMAGVITHKPPGPGDTYVNPFTQPVPLLDANGNPTGIQILREVHTPNPTNTIEVDTFPNTVAQITLRLPSGAAEEVTLSGPTTVNVHIPPNGAASDSDGNGLDDVATEMVQLDLMGNSSMGPVVVHLDPTQPSLGRIEETVNNHPGILDIPPFESTGTANSFFDVFLEIQVGGQILRPAVPVHMQSVITHKPPGPGDTYVNPFTQPIPLLDASGKPTGFEVLREVHTPNPPVEVDTFPNTVAQLTLRLPSGGTEEVTLSGPTTVNVFIGTNGAAGDTDGNGLDDVPTEMVQLDLTGSSSLGPVAVHLDPSHHSLGKIEETVNNHPGILDVPPFEPTGTANSFFDIFLEIDVNGQTLHPATPVRMQSVITHKPPGPGDTYVNPFTQPIPLLDANGNVTGFEVLREVHTPTPPVEVDRFPNTVAEITLQLPNGGTEAVTLTGPTTVNVFIASNGAASDTDGNGLDDVATEMVQLNLTGNSSLGPVLVQLDPSHHSLGKIEETVNNHPGILDIPPFELTGTANSFFDIFLVVKIGGQTLYPTAPVHMAAVITHKPPGPGDTYVNPFTQPIPLLDAAGNPTGVQILREVHTPNPPVEVDTFPNTVAEITLQLPNGPETVILSGPTTVNVFIPPSGAAGDSDGNGLDDVPTEMVQLNLTGNSSLGPVIVQLDPSQPSLGRIEERVNNTPGILDVPPFTPTGSANSFFDVFFTIQVGGSLLHPAAPVHMAGVITHKPPGPGDTYVNPFTQPILLLDANGNPTGIQVLREVHTPNPTNNIEVDTFPNTVAELTLQLPTGPETVTLAGPTTVKVAIGPNGEAGDSNGDGLDDVPTEMVQLDLSGNSSLGLVKVHLDPTQHSVGMIEETANPHPGILDIPPFEPTGTANSFFDIFLTIEVGGQVLHPATSVHMAGLITHKPPGPGDTYVNPFTQPIPLLDANGNPTGLYVLREVHTPNPPVEVDTFPNTVAEITLQLPTGGSEVVSLSGPTTVNVFIPPNGAASDLNGDGLDEVATEMVQLDLTGSSSLGPVAVHLDPSHHSLGGIEETVNNTPGILDVPPFTPTGTARSFFDIFTEIDVNGQAFHPAVPLHMAGLITYKPPGPNDTYVNPFTQPVPLLDANGNPTGILIVREVHTPNPSTNIEVDVFPSTIAEIALQLPSGATEAITLSGPTTVNVIIPSNGAAGDSNGDGLDDVPTEMVQLDLAGNSSLGPVEVHLDHTQHSTGLIEETVNNTPGILDVPPFTATGTAHSTFTLYLRINVNGQVLHPIVPVQMSGLITHKPPGPGDVYINPFTDPIPLVDTNGNQTGFALRREVHTPNPPVEIDTFPNTVAQITLKLPSGGTEEVTLSGPTTVNVFIPANGAASDTDGNGLDDVGTEMVQLDLTGNSSMGPVVVHLDPTHHSLGRIEETVNNTPGVLDVPPFTATGTANSFFDIFLEITVGGQTMRPATPVHMQSVITHKPPGPGDTYVNPFTQPIPLLDAAGRPTGFQVLREVHTPNPPVEVDTFSNTVALLTLQLPSGGTEEVTLSGPTTVNVMIGPNGAATDTDGNGLDDVPTEMVQLDLTGNSSLGPVAVHLDPSHHSLGKIEETVNNHPGVLDVPPFELTGTANSFFDIFLEIDVNGQTLHPATPVRMQSVITHKPPGPGDTYVNPFTQPIPLLDAAGRPTGFQVLHEVHTPTPPVEVDTFPNTVAEITLELPGGGAEVVTLSGPTTVNVFIGSNGAASDTDGNGLDDVPTMMTQLDLTGNSSMGPVVVHLDPAQPTLGKIEETVNNHPGILDIPPFELTGTANSFFDVFLTIQVGGQTLHPAAPIHMQSLITHKPPGPGDTYVNPFTQPVPLLDANGNPTGFRVLREVHTPNPQVEIDSFPVTSAEITLLLPTGGTETVNLAGPTTVHVFIGPNGAANDTDGNGLDDVPTEMVLLNLTGNSSLGPVSVHLDPTRSSRGQIEEQVNNTPGILDIPPFTPTGTANSFFDVFLVVQIGAQTLYPADPVHMAAVITHKPPAPGDTYVNPFTQPVPLLDANGNPTGVYILREVHTPNPIPLTFVCPTNITVTAPDTTGAFVFFNIPATSSCLPVTVTANPPSGSKFPVGNTTVTVVVIDACGHTGTCQFIVTVLPPPTPGTGYFSPTNSLPPANGMYISPAQWHALYANGVIISNVTHRAFIASYPPPPIGTSAAHSFDSEVDFDVFLPGSSQFTHVTAPANVVVSVQAVSPAAGGVQTYQTEMLRLNISGGSLPAGLMVRESPSLPSRGQTMIDPVPGGFLINSFFDVFTEVSLDSGRTWSPSSQSGHVSFQIDPRSVAPAPEPTPLLPPPTDKFFGLGMSDLTFPGGVVIRDVRNRLFSSALDPTAIPIGSGPVNVTFSETVDMQLSTDGGLTFKMVTAPAMVNVAIRPINPGPPALYDTEITQYDLVGGGLPPNIWIRESPSLPSHGGTAINRMSDGSFQISSFFDVFTELSLDGGQTWQPASSGPGRVQLHRIGLENQATAPTMPPTNNQYTFGPLIPYPGGIYICNVVNHAFSPSLPLPPPGQKALDELRWSVDLMLSLDGGRTFNPASAAGSGLVTISNTSPAGTSGTSQYYNTEMLQMLISGGTLPAGVMVRESPSKASLGRTSVTQDPTGGGYRVSSFFDIFTEISLDGGHTWSAALNDSVIPLGPPPGFAPYVITCPSNITVYATGPSGAVVNWTMPPIIFFPDCPFCCFAATCVPPSGSLFPIGTTTVHCEGHDGCGERPTCDFTVTVIQPFIYAGLLDSILGSALLNLGPPIGTGGPPVLVVSNVGTAGTDGFHLYLGTADSAQLNFQPFLTTVSCPTDFVAIATGPFLSDPNHVMGEGMYFGGSNPKVSADFSTLGATAMILEVRDQDGKLILSNYLANGAAVNINNLFPPPCTNTTTVYSYGQTPDHICYRFCKYGCDCSGTNCYIERVACFRPDLATLPLNLHLTDLELRAAGSAPFRSFTIQSEEIGKFGLRHGAIGQAQFDAQPDLLVVENLGSSGQDGVFVDLKAAGKFDMMLAPVLLENQSACWEMEAIGRVNSMANSPIGAVLFMHQVGPGGGCLVSADFSVIGSTQTRVEIYHASQFVGSTIIAGTSLGRMPLHGNIIDAGVVAQPSPGFRVLYDGIFSFIAANGNSFTGDEIRMLAANPAERVQSISEFAVLSCGTGQFAILGELAPPVLLNVSRQGTGPFEIDGQGVAGTMYTLQATSSLAAPIQWTPVDSVVSDPDGSFHLVDPRTTVFTQQFYRVVTSQP